MSNTELHTGKLTPVKTINSHQEFMDFVHENKLTEHYTSSIEIYLDYEGITDVTATNGCLPLLLCACQDRRGLPQFCFYKNVIYRFNNYIIEEDDYINKFSRNSDGSIGFVCLFYNGGTCFSEELQDGLDILLNEESKNEYR
ncbi:hypothetical protein [uncultured Gilliamella sp.]|uniref:hypothetical protein n=1 Tax=uncultured Gilliamella sp. TaxID=1193505 RepID=UPI0025D05ED4|nr:hypothetical protein [uncultured Gilliamella sp.]